MPFPLRLAALSFALFALGCADADAPDAPVPDALADAPSPADPFPEDTAALLPDAAPDAPALDVGTLGGGRFSLDEQAGRVVLVQFWTTWSEPARSHLDALGSALRVMGPAASALVVAADVEGAQAVAPVVAASGVAVPVAVDADGALAQSLGGVRMYPTTFVIDAEGRLRARHVGALDEAGLLELAGPYLIERAAPPMAADGTWTALPSS